MDDDQRWERVLRRDTDADGEFLYGVLTTGIYCRPTCPSRRPLRENVRFFESRDEARAAGLRACRRCEPDGPGAEARRQQIVEAVCRLIDEADTTPALSTLAAAVGLSTSRLQRVFTSTTGVTPAAYADARRAGRVREALDDGASVTEAVYAAGFGSSGRFYATSNERLGMTPSQYRRGGDDVDVRFAIARTQLGPLLVAASDRGICTIEFGDDPESLVELVQDRFHSARLTGDDPDFDRLVADVVALVDEPGRGADLPLDIRGTVFQERVWRALRAVPPGTTVSYAELAARIGEPSAARAVAGACAANRLAVAVPCHRVVRTDGSLSGYRWGVERKRALLELEGRLTAPG